ncbi:MAG: site-2 protease family protein, partial [Xanthomonadales bacterium]|nr:site-2 protease family protein [Xanthomonadales bacterium]
MDFLYIFIGILILIPLASWLMLVIKLYGTRLTRVHFKPLPVIKLPPANEQQFKLAQTDLESLGFELLHYHAYRDLIVSDNKPTVGMVLKNDQHQCYALITNPHNPDLNRPYGIRFQSFNDQLTIEAMDADAEGVIKSFDQLHTYNFQTSLINEAFEEFLNKRKELFTKQPSNILYFKSAESYCSHMQTCYDQYLKHLYRSGLVHKKGNTLQLRFSESLKLAWQLMTDKKKVTPIKPVEAPPLIEKYAFLPQVQAQAHRKVQTNQQASQLSHWGKTLLFIASALMFALLFGIAWSPFLVIILIPVLLFHELGHYLAMKAFGYRDLQILFLPIGAMAAGNKVNPSPLQKTIVSLAGPLPGLLVAFALAVWAPDFIYTEYGLSMIFMLIIINYLNLLPFMPLDGGHVINQLLFDRWPMLQFVLMLISVCIFALGAWAWSDPILTVLALVIGLGLKGNYQQAKYVIQARNRWGEKLKNRDNIAVAYYLMKEDASPFIDKYQSVIPINDRLRHQSPTWRDSLLGMVMYLTAIVGPLIAVDKIIGLDVFALLGGAFSNSEAYETYDSFDPDKWAQDYWPQQFQSAATVSA